MHLICVPQLILTTTLRDGDCDDTLFTDEGKHREVKSFSSVSAGLGFELGTLNPDPYSKPQSFILSLQREQQRIQLLSSEHEPPLWFHENLCRARGDGTVVFVI